MSFPRRTFLESALVLAGGAAFVHGAHRGGRRRHRFARQDAAHEVRGQRRDVVEEAAVSSSGFNKAAEFGFPAVEFWPYEGKNIDEVNRTCEELNLAIAQFTAWGFMPGMNDPKNHDRLVKKIDEACQVAKQINCPHDDRRRRQRSDGHDAGRDAREHHHGAEAGRADRRGATRSC